MNHSETLERTILYDKILASLLGGAIGDAMGGPVEGLDYQEIGRSYGIVENLLPYERPPDYHAHFATAPGAITDDTRLKHILCRAISDCGDLPKRGDFVRACVEAYYLSSNDLERGFLEEYVLAAMYGDEKLIWGGQPTNGFIMANSPLGLICPCDPDLAFTLSYDLDFISGGYARYSAAMAAAATAAAMCPEATVDSIIEAALQACQRHRREGELSKDWHWFEHVFQLNERLVRKAVDIAARHGDVFSVRAEFYRDLKVSPLGSEAAQTLAVALGMLVAAGGDFRQTVIGCVNYGRDNDSYASVAGAIAGALNGLNAIPPDWYKIVETANPEPDMRSMALELTEVAHRRQQRIVHWVAEVGKLFERSQKSEGSLERLNQSDQTESGGLHGEFTDTYPTFD